MTNQPSYQWDRAWVWRGELHISFPTEPVFVSLSRSMTDSRNRGESVSPDPMRILYAREGQHGVLPWSINFLCNCDSAKVPFKSRMSTARSVCMNLFVLDVIISNELLKKLFQERWTLCFSGSSYFKFWRVLCAFHPGLQLQHVWIWCRGMERYSPSRTLLHTPSRPAAPLYSREKPSQVRTIWRKYDGSLLFLEETFDKLILDILHAWFLPRSAWLNSVM